MICLHRILRVHALRLAIAAFMIAPGASAVAAECAQWNVAGEHSLMQSNVRYSVGDIKPIQMTLQQDGALFKGTASFYYRNGDVDAMLYRSGDIVGTVAGNQFEATVYWDDNKVGVYSGQVGPQGLVVGRTYNKNNPAESADFHGSPAFDCLAKAAPNAGASNGNNDSNSKPALVLGRVQLRPSIVEPQKGGVYASQTPLRVRVAPGKGASDAAYRIEIQRQKLSSTSSSSWNIEWLDVLTADTTAGVAQSTRGYRDWGGAQSVRAGAEMTASGGLYRIRARATAPQASPPGDWVEFRINGPRGTQDDAQAKAPAGNVQNRVVAATLNAQSAAPSTSAGTATLNAQTLTPRALGGAAVLNPQPLPPRTLPAAPAAKPLNAGTRNTDAVTPTPATLAPGSLQQAPSSMR